MQGFASVSAVVVHNANFSVNYLGGGCQTIELAHTHTHTHTGPHNQIIFPSPYLTDRVCSLDNRSRFVMFFFFHFCIIQTKKPYCCMHACLDRRVRCLYCCRRTKTSGKTTDVPTDSRFKRPFGGRVGGMVYLKVVVSIIGVNLRNYIFGGILFLAIGGEKYNCHQQFFVQRYGQNGATATVFGILKYCNGYFFVFVILPVGRFKL